jgi:glucosamine--fructose-6-phosphate aminotransferase (isomerizing)
MREATAYERDVLAQPDVLRDVCRRFGREVMLPRWAADWWDRGRPPLILTGMGASLHATQVAEVVLARAGLPVRALAISELLDHGLSPLPKDSIVVVVSQSGESAELEPLLDRLPADRLRAVTNRPDSYLASKVPETLLLKLDHDRSIAIRTYTATIAVLLLLAAELSGEPSQRVAASILRTADRIEEQLPRWQASMAPLVNRLANVRATSFVGWGWGTASAREAALLFKEGARKPSEAMSAPEFRHGSVEVLDARHAIVVFTTDDGGHDIWAYVDEFLALGPELVTIGGSPPSGLHGGRLHPIAVDHEPGAAAALAEIIPIQILAAAIAREEGFEIGQFRNTTPVVSTIPVRTVTA